MTIATESRAPEVPRARRPRGWAAKFGDWATQYDAPGGAIVTLMRYTHPSDADSEIGVWQCSCGQRADQEPYPLYPDAKAAAEEHAACTAPELCRHCRGTGLARTR
jgi:hypothetical protein